MLGDGVCGLWPLTSPPTPQRERPAASQSAGSCMTRPREGWGAPGHRVSGARVLPSIGAIPVCVSAPCGLSCTQLSHACSCPAPWLGLAGASSSDSPPRRPPWLPQPLPHPRQPAPGSAHLRGQWGAGVARPPTGAQETQRELANLTFAGTPLSLSVRGSLRCTSWLQGLPEVLARPQAAPQVGGASFQLLAPPSAPPVRASEPWAGARPWKVASDLPSISSRPHRKAGDIPTTWTRP